MSAADNLGEETAETFFATCDQFKLGGLVTESPNPITSGLAEACQKNLPNGLQMLQLADVACLQRLISSKEAMPKITRLAEEIHKVLEAGHVVFFEGCGATGRLSLTIEVLAREGLVEDRYRDQVKGFMAGGDAALIRSIEQFEDRRDFGARQLQDLGFVDGDLCVAITEGGETTFVIAAVEEAVRLGPSKKHWFLYCNPDDVLCVAAERSKHVIENAAIEKINLTCGPMGITGSTRMQATTVQLLVAGLALQHHSNPSVIPKVIEDFALVHGQLDYACLAPATKAEAELYANKIFFSYRTDYFTCTVLTDTTERAPTFSLPSFENFSNESERTLAPTPVYLHLPGTRSAHEAWLRLLRREPRGIAWDACYGKTGNRAIYGYDFSDHVVAKRRPLISDALAARSDNGAKLEVDFALDDIKGSHPHIRFQVPLASSLLGGGDRDDDDKTAAQEVKYVTVKIPVPQEWVTRAKFTTRFLGEREEHLHFAEPLLLNVLAKMVLNSHSTALMGINGRIRSNVMTYVRPSNKKLIDRAARYVTLLFNELQQNFAPADRKVVGYEEVVKEIFEQRKTLGPSDPIVVKVLDSMIKKSGSKTL